MHVVTDDKLSLFDPRDDDAWTARQRADLLTAEAFQTVELQAITHQVVLRARETGAMAVALTGSTARQRRTLISDLDYHVVGERPSGVGLPGDVDLYVSSSARLTSKILKGDDFAQWTLRHGCILEDTGVLRDAGRLVVDESIWPDGAAKLARLSTLCDVARDLIEMEDRDAAQDQIRAALTSGARALLLLGGVFPLSRSELPEQLRLLDLTALADHLESTIYSEPGLRDLKRSLRTLERAVRSEVVPA